MYLSFGNKMYVILYGTNINPLYIIHIQWILDIGAERGGLLASLAIPFRGTLHSGLLPYSLCS